MIAKKVLSVEANLMTKVHIHAMSTSTELSILVFVSMITALTGHQKFCKSCFPHCIHQPNVSFKALMLLGLFRIMLSKCRHYIPEPRFQTKNQETWKRAIMP